jgi:type IX secretion system PorP/SprF family membrane protein
MKLKKFTFALLLAMLCGSVFAQDLHFTQFYLAPLHTNPSATGGFLGSYRLGGVYRSQYSFGGVKGYSTPNLSVDVPLGFAFRKQDWIGIGVNIIQDKSGAGELQKGGLEIVAAYHLALNKKQTQELAFGVQYGQMSRKIDASLLLFEDQIRNGGQSAELMTINASAKGYTDIAAGVTFKTELNKTSKMSIGFAMHHINSPEYNLLNSPNSKLPPKYTLHGVFDMDLSKQLSLSPGFIFQTIAGQSEIGVQSLIGYKLDPKKDLKLITGLGYRLGDALQIFLGAQFGSFRVGGAFDYTVSELNTGNPKNGLEVGVTYIGRIFKNPDVKQAILCPRY